MKARIYLLDNKIRYDEEFTFGENLQIELLYPQYSNEMSTCVSKSLTG